MNKNETPVETDLRVFKGFAWLPRYVGSELVWLRNYRQMWEYRHRDRVCPLTRRLVRNVGAWELLYERPMRRTPFQINIILDLSLALVLLCLYLLR